jgi:cyanophycin synthetase
MNADHSLPPAVGLARAVDVLGPPGRELAVAVDLLRAAGARAAAARLRDEARARRRHAGAGASAYPELWRAAAGRIGARVGDLGGGFLEITRDGRRAVVRDQRVPLDSAVTLELALDKRVMTRILRDRGLPVPEQAEYGLRQPRAALDLLLATRQPCVVKPVRADGGSGATCGVRSASDLARASLRAARTDRRLLIERQAPGDVHRLLYLNGRLIGAVRRRPPTVTGDGTSTVLELIRRQNRATHAGGRPGASLLRVDLDCDLALRRAGHTLASVPPRGAVVRVKGAVSQNAAGDNDTVTDAVHPTVAAAGAEAAAAAGLRLAGVDVIAADIAAPLAAGAVVLEVNGAPGLLYHYRVADPAGATDVAVPILRAVLDGG